MDPLKALFAKRPAVIKPGLARIQEAFRALEPLGAPCVLVGGTNGKGSTSGALFRLLSAAGVNTGLFTSPHLIAFNERIVTTSGPTSDSELIEHLATLQADLTPSVYGPMSFFEVNTVLALRLFRARQTAFDVLEVGLGGRFDSTNAVEPEISIITSIGLDHQEWLGDTVEKIAFEKCGIMRRGKPTFWSGQGAPEACAVIEAEAKRQGAELRTLGRDFALESPLLPASWRNSPPFLRQSYALAAAAFSWLARKHGWKSPAPEAVLRVPLPASLRARFELVEHRGRKLLLDVGHNPDGVEALLVAMREAGWIDAGKKVPMVVSVLTDKDCDGILDRLRPHAAPLILWAASGERAWSRQRLAERHRDLPWAADFEEALREAKGGEPVLVCGSVHALGEVLVHL